MRFSEQRIQHLARQMADAMIEQQAVDPKIGRANLSSLIAQVMINDLRVEDEIDGEVRDRLSRQRNLPPQGTGEYEAMFEKVKREIAQRRGWPM